jgi:hypothetical protein
MTKPSEHEDYGEQGPLKNGERRHCLVRWRKTMALMALVALIAGCGDTKASAIAGSGSNTTVRTVSTNSSSAVMAQMVAYARCMRGHGISDFPDPHAQPWRRRWVPDRCRPGQRPGREQP